VLKADGGEAIADLAVLRQQPGLSGPVASDAEKESATPTWKSSFGYHPLLCFLDATGKALAGILRAGNAGSNTA
jgi:hypothetical protein